MITERKVSLSSVQPVRFYGIDSREKYFTQCVVVSKTIELFKTDVVSIDLARRPSVFSRVLLILIVLLCCFVLFLLAQQRKRQRALFATVLSVMGRYGIDEMETVGLLKRKPVHGSLLRFDRFDEEEDNLLSASPIGIQCGRCGFMNPTDATVCRECNSILEPLCVCLFQQTRQMSKRR